MIGIRRQQHVNEVRTQIPHDTGVHRATDPKHVRRRSRGFVWYSPILNEQLHGKSADLIVLPRNEHDVIRTTAACARHRVPITVRAGGTGNYGQAVPLQGGILLLEINALADIEWIKPWLLCVGAGARMSVIDSETQVHGFELRMHPSTKRTATIGGFVAGGSGGISSVNYGGLREPGNILAARIVTVETQPRVIELRCDAAQKINRAYGTTGIITAPEMPLAPAWKWIDVVVAFDDFMMAAAVGHELALADGIVKKVLAPIAWPPPFYFGALKRHCPDGKAILIAMIAEAAPYTFLLRVRRSHCPRDGGTDELLGVCGALPVRPSSSAMRARCHEASRVVWDGSVAQQTRATTILFPCGGSVTLGMLNVEDLH